MTKTRKRKGQVAKLVEPEFLSVVKSPSNRTGFKIIRSAEGTDRVVRTRKKRSDSNLLSIDLPMGVTLAQAQEILELFDLSEDYDIVSTGDQFVLMRKGSDPEADTVAISLGEGIIANVVPAVFSRSEDDTKTDGVQLVALEFTGEQFSTVESVREWLDTNEIDFIEGGVSFSDADSEMARTALVLRTDREDAANCTHNMTVTLADGVTGILGIAEETDIPKRVYRQVVEAAYGSWGVWQLDFNAAMADKNYTDESYVALDALNMVLHNVMFSDKTIEQRKTLVQSVLKQFGEYVNGLLESLPTEVMRKTYSKDHKLLKQESENMSTEDKKVDMPEADDQQSSQEVAQPISREDIDAMIGTAIERAITPVAEALSILADKVKNSEPEEGGEGGEEDDEGAEEIAKISRSVSEMGESMKTMMESIEALKGQIDEIGNTTVARSDESDDVGANGEQNRKRSEGPFSGLFDSVFR